MERPQDMNTAIEAEAVQRGGYPLILTLDTHGVPHRWISWQHACYYYSKDQVAWATGAHAFTVFGGMNRLTGRRSSITASSIIAIKGKAMAMKSFSQVPPLNNRELFHRDRQICAYCGGMFPISKLTRDHVTPFSRKGKDTWMNSVTACRACNERKGNHTPEQAGMELMVQGDPLLRRPYLVEVSPKAPEAARELAAFLRSPETQAWISTWGKGKLDALPVFFPVTIP